VTVPILELRAVWRDYLAGDSKFAALKGIDLVIEAGEFVAVIGPSGSGKSTLMNILGCLDRPTAGVYHVAGQDTAQLDSDALAALRRERFGFIFQRYNLLPDLTAIDNVEIPAVYAGEDRSERHTRAWELLRRLKLSDRLYHLPSQLSGGQQQRVSIARALMNGGEILLADEPTGALDSQVGEEVLSFLKELHAQGHAIILVTHDPKVAQHAERIIELADGAIVSDRPAGGTAPIDFKHPPFRRHLAPTTPSSLRNGVLEALRLSLLAMRAHRMRTFLTMLGIVIGIASVASVVALGAGGRERVLADIRGIGTNTLVIYPGKDWGDEKAFSIRTLTPSDAQTIMQQSYVDSVTPMITAQASVRFGNVSVSGSINGVGDQYFRVHNFEVTEGQVFSETDTRDLAQVGVIDDNIRQKLFVNGEAPIGQVILLGKMLVRVIGVAQSKGNLIAADQNLNVWVPYTSVMGRVLGPSSLRSITARIRDAEPMDVAADAVTQILITRHGRKDFFIFNADTIRKTAESATTALTLLISSIAVISLIVGGIGVTNIMLVSVTERTREIGIRTAVGARQSDIMRQFQIEAVLVCLVGGALGVTLALAIGFIYSRLSTNFPMMFSSFSIVVSLLVSTLIGVTSGYLPARHAASLNPVDALARE
jgi:macrolide transport system ATP-binding/permease protein